MELAKQEMAVVTMEMEGYGGWGKLSEGQYHGRTGPGHPSNAPGLELKGFPSPLHPGPISLQVH